MSTKPGELSPQTMHRKSSSHQRTSRGLWLAVLFALSSITALIALESGWLLPMVDRAVARLWLAVALVVLGTALLAVLAYRRPVFSIRPPRLGRMERRQELHQQQADLTQVLRSVADESDLLTRGTAAIAESLQAEGAVFIEAHAPTGPATLRATYGAQTQDQFSGELRIDAGQFPEIAYSQPMIYLPDVSRAPDELAFELLEAEGPASILALRVMAGGELAGLLILMATEQWDLAAEELSFAQAAAANLGSQLWRIDQETASQLEYEAAQLLSELGDPSETQQSLLQLTCIRLGLDVCQVWRPDSARGLLTFHDQWQSLSIPANRVAREQAKPYRPGEGLLGQVWASAKPAWDLGESTHEVWAGMRLSGGTGLAGGIALPLLAASEPGSSGGVLLFLWSARPPLRMAQRQALLRIAGLYAAYLARAEAFQDLQERLADHQSLVEDVFGRSKVAFMVLDSKLRLAWANRQYEQVFGVELEDLLGQEATSVLADRLGPGLMDGVGFAAQVRQSYQEGEYLRGIELELAAPPDDGPGWLEYGSTPIEEGPYAGGRIESFIDVSQRHQVQEQARRRASQQAAAAELGKRALAELDPQRLAQEAVELTAESMQVAWSTFVRFDENADHLVLEALAGTGSVMAIGEVMASDTRFELGYALFSSGPILVEDYSTETRFEPAPYLPSGSAGGAVAVAVSSGGQPYGVLAVHTAQSSHFTAEDVAFVQLVANILSDAIERGEGERALRRAREELERRVNVRTLELQAANQELQQQIDERRRAEDSAKDLLQASQRLARNLDPDRLLDELVIQGLRLTGAKAGWAGLRSDGGFLSSSYQRTDRVTELPDGLDPAAGLPALVLETARPVLVVNSDSDKRVGPVLRRRLQVVSALTVPVLDGDGRPIAFLELHDKLDGSVFTSFDLDRASALAEIASIKFQNALAYRRLSQAELELQRSTHQLEEAQELADMGSWEWDLALGELTWSAEMYRVYGLDPEGEPITYDRFMDLVHPEDQGWMQERIDQAYQDHQPFSFHHRIVTPAGRVRILHGRGRILTDEAGRPTGMRGTGQDITGVALMEQALGDQTRLYQSLLDAQSDMGLGVVALEAGEVAYVNEAMGRITGYKPEELKDLDQIVGLIVPEERQHVRGLIGEGAGQQSGLAQHETSIKTKSGQQRHIEFSRKVTPSEDRARVFLLVRDITRRRRATDLAEGLLKTSKRLAARLEADPLLEAIAEEAAILAGARAAFAARKTGDRFVASAYVAGEQWVPLAASFALDEPRQEHLTSEPGSYRSTDEVPVLPPIVPEDTPAARSMLLVPIRDRELQLIGFIELHDSENGDEFTEEDVERVEALAQIAAVALENALAYQTLQEVERRIRRSEERLRTFSSRLEAARERERTQIAREVHDELGQALTGLKMDIVWLRDRIEAGPSEKESALLRKRAADMAKLIDDTIETVRRIATELRPGVLDDLGLVAAVEWQVGEFTKRSGIPCSLTTNLELIELPGRVATGAFRILQEALTNVARHANASQVRVRLKELDGWLKLEVEDNGVGLGKDAEEVSEGLGLVGIRERASLLGGKVEFESWPDQGTKVAIQLPTKPPETDEDAP